ncbi:MAG TPA: hypothetical protein VL490_00360 [Mucilaginibacter sp.]|jgi:hypothetical protein|nr:hypothetical protein [Mucilaginibacter sp.]
MAEPKDMSSNKDSDAKDDHSLRNDDVKLPSNSINKKKAKKDYTIIVNVPEQQNRTAETANEIAKEANKVSWRSVRVNSLLLGITLVVACISIWQGCLTRRSVAIADSVFKADTTNAGKVYKQSRIDANANDKREDDRDKRAKRNLDIQDSSLKAQIKSFQETQKEFEMESRPFITVANVIIDTPALNSKIKGTAQIINSGKQPAYIVSAYYDWRMEPDSGYHSMEKIQHQNSAENSVIVGGGSISFWTNSQIITSDRMEYYKTHPLYRYVRAMITYKGFSKNKIYRTELMYRVLLKTDKDSKTVFYDSN